MRANWKRLSIGLAAFAAMGVPIWFGFARLDSLRGFAVGVYAGLAIAAVYHWCVLASGAAMSVMGQNAEQWTHAELQRLRRRGWRVVNHIDFSGDGDIDHVAIGPDGVIVMETKWRSGRVDLSRQSGMVADAERQVLKGTSRIEGRLRDRKLPDAEVTALIVVWGPEVTQLGDEPLRTASGVNVIAGEHLRLILRDLGDQRLSSDEVDRIYDALVTDVERRDVWLSLNTEPRPPTLIELAQNWGRRVVVGLTGFIAAGVSLNLGWWYFAVAAVLLVAGITARRVVSWRPLTTAWVIGTQSVTALVLVELVVERVG